MADREKNKKKFLLFLILLGVLLLLGFFALTFFVPQGPPEPKTLQELSDFTKDAPIPEADKTEYPGINELDHVRGPASAPIVIIEYADFNSYYAKLMQPGLAKLVAANNGKVKWVFRHFVLDPGPVTGQVKSEASECVFLQKGHDGFWAFADRMYEFMNRLEARKVALDLGVDAQAFDTCMADGAMTGRVNFDAQQAWLTTSIRGIPAFMFVNTATGETRLLDEARGMESVQAIVDAMLAQ